MKKLAFIFILFIISNHLFSQKKEGNYKLIYNVGMGPGIEGNFGLIGIVLEQELDYQIKNRIILSGSLLFFQSTGNIEKGYPLKEEFNSHSGIFTNIEGTFLMLNKQKLKLGVSIGPSFQIGSVTYNTSTVDDGNTQTHYYEHFQHNRLGYSTGIMASWAHKNPNRQSSIKLRMYSFEGYYGYFLMTGYRLGFKIK
jgi:hypothetical protein